MKIRFDGNSYEINNMSQVTEHLYNKYKDLNKELFRADKQNRSEYESQIKLLECSLRMIAAAQGKKSWRPDGTREVYDWKGRPCALQVVEIVEASPAM